MINYANAQCFSKIYLDFDYLFRLDFSLIYFPGFSILWTFFMCSWVWLGYQKLERQTGQVRLTSSSSSSGRDDFFTGDFIACFGTEPVATILRIKFFPWAELTFMTVLGPALAASLCRASCLFFWAINFFLCSALLRALSVIFSSTTQISSSDSSFLGLAPLLLVTMMFSLFKVAWRVEGVNTSK